MNTVFGFLFTSTGALELFGSEAETRAMLTAVRVFVSREVLPARAALERGDLERARDLLSKAASLGLTGLEIPERHGGVGLRHTPAMEIIAEVARQPSFSASLGAHIGIGTFPLVLFGTPECAARYLPQLASGARIGAYALTEAGAGSDALAVETRAVRDGSDFVLTGEKQFITNAPIAGLYTVFAKVGDAFTAFLVPAETPGVEARRPERKMGLHGSPTSSVRFDGVRVPAEHVLGEIGAGHRVAFNTLNLGRMKLGFGSLGCAKEALALATSYAARRRQFGRPIGEFGLIRDKLATMATEIRILEAVSRRVTRSVDAWLGAALAEAPRADVIRTLKAHAPLSAIVKVLGSDTVGRVVDKAVQIHGGNGFMEDYEVAGMYRDVRVNRIFEGTNEVNRLLIAKHVLRRFVSGVSPRPALGGPEPGAAEGASGLCEVLRWVIARVAVEAVRGFGAALHDEQVLLSDLADLTVELYALDTFAASSAKDDEPYLRLATEAARGRVTPRLIRAATRVGLAPSAFVAPVMAGASDVAEDRERIAAQYIDRIGSGHAFRQKGNTESSALSQ